MSHAAVRCWLAENTPLEHSLLEGAGFDAHVAERISGAGGSESAYIAALNHSPAEVDRLIAGIAVPETWLFRYPRAFDLLLDFLQRRLASRALALRMISVGCATGQEPYCMAMTALHAGWPAERVAVEALDRNADVLRLAAAAEYSASSIRSELPKWAARFLQRSGEQLTIDPSARAVVCFRRAEASDPAVIRSLGPCDVIFCRNLLIYLNANARASLMESFASALAPGGLLFTGHAEQMHRSPAQFRPVPASHAFALERIEAQVSPPARTRPSNGIESIVVAPVRDRARIARPEFLPPPIASGPLERSLDDARELADAGRTQEAEALIRSILARHPACVDALELLALVRMAQSDSAGARRLFEQAVYLEPTRSTSLLQLAIISDRSGDARKAAVLWDRARRAAADVPQERPS